MTAKALLLFLLLPVASFAANAVDSLQTNEEVQAFVHKIDNRLKDFSVVDAPWSGYTISPENGKFISDSLQVKVWEKADFNNDGASDLLVNGLWYTHPHGLVFISTGKSFEFFLLTMGHFSDPIFPLVTRVNNRSLVVVHPTARERKKVTRNGKTTFEYESKMSTDTLIFLFGGFIEYNAHPQHHTIQKVEYLTTGCFGECPIFKLAFDNKRAATYDATHYNKLEGNYTGTIDTARYNELMRLLDYLAFPQLKDDYEVNWTDDQGCSIIITYDGGKKKTISDYGLIGTYGLALVYEKLFALRESLEWVKTN